MNKLTTWANRTFNLNIGATPVNNTQSSNYDNDSVIEKIKVIAAAGGS